MHGSFYKIIFSRITCQVRTEWNAWEMIENTQWSCQEGVKEKTLVSQVPVRPHLVGLIPTPWSPTAPPGSSLSLKHPPPRCLTSIVALTVCSAWEGLASDVLMAPSFWAFRHWLISHLLSEAFLNHLILRSNSLHRLSSSAFIILHSKHFIYLIFWCAWLEFKLREGKRVSVLYLSSFPEQAGTH